MSAHGDVDLGHTVAGWTGTAVACLGAAGAGVAFCTGSARGVWLGAAVVTAAALASLALHLAGWGKPPGPRPADQWDWRVRDAQARSGHHDCFGCRLARRAPRTGRVMALSPRAEPVPAADQV